jgi:hypothetical protein
MKDKLTTHVIRWKGKKEMQLQQMVIKAHGSSISHRIIHPF